MKRKCFSCGHEIGDNDDNLEYNGEIYCSECYDECGECGQLFPSVMITYVDSNDTKVCNSCLDDFYRGCYECGELFHFDDLHYIDEGDLYVCDGCFDSGYGWCDGCDRTFRIDHLTYSEEQDRTYCPDCYEEYVDDEEKNTFSYHSGYGRDDKSDGYRYRVGIELEREDIAFKESISAYDFLEKTGWVVERDCSLDDLSGFEAISPIYPLKLGKLERIFNSDDIKKLARTEYSCCCGGHITISDTKRTPTELIDDIGGYLPILYAMFPKRVNNGYCSPLKKDNYKYQSGHYALSKRGNGRGDGLEIRLFDAPKDEKDILNRFRLLKYMLQHKATTIEQGLENLNEIDGLRKAVKYHLDIYDIPYKTFYTNLVEYAKNIDLLEVRADVEQVESILSK